MEKRNDSELDAIIGGFYYDYAKQAGVFVCTGFNGKECGSMIFL